MNLYGRLLLCLLQMLFRTPKFDIHEPSKMSFRVWLHDMDINIHLTAARYLSFCDLARTTWLHKNDVLGTFIRKGYMAVLNAQEITYIREFKPFSRVDTEVELKCWDEKYGYFEQRFYCKGKLYAVSHARVAFLHKRKVVGFDDFLIQMGKTPGSPPETEAITDWKETLRAKKDYFS